MNKISPSCIWLMNKISPSCNWLMAVSEESRSICEAEDRKRDVSARTPDTKNAVMRKGFCPKI